MMKRATVVSLTVHGAALLLLVARTGKHAPPPPPVALTEVEIIDAAPVPATAPVPAAAAPPAHTARHASPRAPQPGAAIAPRTMQAVADLTIRTEEATGFADHDRARLADATRDLGAVAIGATGLDLPDVPSAGSQARAPRPKHDYTNLRVVGASRFAGRTISLRLSIDEHGKVRAVQLLRGVDRDIDRKTVALVHDFEYEPARGDDGAPIAGTQRWEFQVVENEDDLVPAAGPPRARLERRVGA